jgi:hypothetical protein
MYAHRKVEEGRKHTAGFYIPFHATSFRRKLLVTNSTNRPILRTQKYDTLTNCLTDQNGNFSRSCS